MSEAQAQHDANVMAIHEQSAKLRREAQGLPPEHVPSGQQMPGEATTVGRQVLEPDTRLMLFHARLLHPGAPRWAVVSINSLAESGRTTQARPFPADDDAQVEEAVRKQNTNGRNIYICAGTPLDSWQGPNPPKKDEIGLCGFLHADIDFRVGEDPDVGRERVLAEIKKADGVPWPSLVWATGGGIQCAWILDAPLPPGEAEPRNLWLAAKLCGDHTQNCNRLLRLAGGVNWPNAKKARRGRVPAMSYAIAGFEP